MIVPEQKPFSFKHIEIITMVLTKLYFLRDALNHFGEETGMRQNEKENETVKYELWKKEISLDNYTHDKILVQYFIDRINYHIRLQKNIKKTFKLDYKTNPFLKTEFHNSTNETSLFNFWLNEKFEGSCPLDDSHIQKIIDIDQHVFLNDETMDPKYLMEEGNRIWSDYKFNESYSLPKMDRLSDYKYTELKATKKENNKT